MTLAVNIAQSGSNNQTFRNRIINGQMVVDQRNAGAAVTPVSLTYTVDRWSAAEQTDGSMTVQQSTVAPAGFTNSLLTTVTSADSSLGATQYAVLRQAIEGFNIADLAWGTASAQPVTLSFWVRSSLTGTFGGALQNSAQDRSYPFSFTISAANTFEYKTITIPGDTTGTWLTTNGIGISLFFGLGIGSTYSGTAGAWAGSLFFAPTGATNVLGTNGATFYITGVQLEEGTAASPFEFRQYGTELALCQRYYQQFGGETTYQYYGMGVSQATTSTGVFLNYLVPMRAAPSFNITNIGNTMVLGLGGTKTPASFGLDQTTTTNIQFSVGGMSGLTTYGAYQYLNNNSTAPRLTLSAEL